MPEGHGPAEIWPPPMGEATATKEINRLARSDPFKITYTTHARDQMVSRDLLMGDVLYILKNGFVFAPVEKSTQHGLYKYRIQSLTPNSGNRMVRVVVIPDSSRCWAKIVTVMWVDE